MTAPVPPISDQRGCCGMCGNWYEIRNDHLLPIHQRDGDRCLGSGGAPVMTSAMNVEVPYASVDTGTPAE